MITLRSLDPNTSSVCRKACKGHISGLWPSQLSGNNQTQICDPAVLWTLGNAKYRSTFSSKNTVHLYQSILKHFITLWKAEHSEVMIPSPRYNAAYSHLPVRGSHLPSFLLEDEHAWHVQAMNTYTAAETQLKKKKKENYQLISF